MKRNFKMVLSYDGTGYNGWQKQGNTANTIQEKLDSILSLLFCQSIAVIGSGRTDAGVHALGQCANFYADTGLTVEEALRRIRSAMPKDIEVLSLEETEERFHARLNASGKKYSYFIRGGEIKDVFRSRYEWAIPSELDLEKMREAADIFLGEHDFRAFSTNVSAKKNTRRSLSSVSVEQTGSLLRIDYVGNGFLYHMARKMTGVLAAVGKGEMTAEEIERLLMSSAEAKNLPMAPAKGLFLVEVFYE